MIGTHRALALPHIIGVRRPNYVRKLLAAKLATKKAGNGQLTAEFRHYSLRSAY
jgi:hypothetical protein